MDKLLNGFLARYQSKDTRTTYLRNLKNMMASINKPINQIELSDLDTYINNLNLSNSSKAQNVATIKSFFKYLKKIKVVDVNVSLELEAPSYNNKVRDFVPFSEMKKLIDVGKNQRDKAIVATYLSLGLRVTELINLTLSDYKSDKMIIKTKGNKDRVMFLNESAKKYIDEYLKVRKASEYDNLFISNACKPMSARSLNNTLKTLSNRAGITKNISNHSLRHSLVTELIENCGIEPARVYIGHSDIRTTQRYSHIDEGRIEQMANSIIL